HFPPANVCMQSSVPAISSRSAQSASRRRGLADSPTATCIADSPTATCIRAPPGFLPARGREPYSPADASRRAPRPRGCRADPTRARRRGHFLRALPRHPRGVARAAASIVAEQPASTISLESVWTRLRAPVGSTWAVLTGGAALAGLSLLLAQPLPSGG